MLIIYRYIVFVSQNSYSATLEKGKMLVFCLAFCLVCVCFLFGFTCVWLGWVGMGGEKTDPPRSI